MESLYEKLNGKYMHYVSTYVAMYLSMLNDCLIVSKLLELYSLSCISPDRSLFSIFNKSKLSQHIPGNLRMSLYLSSHMGAEKMY